MREEVKKVFLENIPKVVAGACSHSEGCVPSKKGLRRSPQKSAFGECSLEEGTQRALRAKAIAFSKKRLSIACLKHALKNKKILRMATRTSILRMKAVRKFGLPFWPWRRLNLKQAKIVSKIHKKLSNQTRNQDMKRKKSQFFYHVRAKKLMSLLYGKLHTSYLVSLFKKSNAHKGKTISNFFAALETRLDTTLYRVQFAPTLQAARQLISHQKICVNNVVLTKPGYILQPGDVISIAPNAIAHVGQSIQQFLRADNTQTALRTVGLLKKFRARRRKRKPFFKRLRFRMSFQSKRVLTQARIRQHMADMKKNTHTYKDLAWKEATPSKKMLLKMRVKMRLHMMKEKRQKRFKLLLKNNGESNLVLKRPKTRAMRLRFQRTAKGIPVKTWVAKVLKNMKAYTLKKKLKKKTKMELHQKKKTWKTPQAGLKKRRKKMRKKYPFRFVTKKVFYKPTHLEVNYHTLHIVYLFKPHYVYFPIKLELQHVAGAFQR